jgi:TonB family protein
MRHILASTLLLSSVLFPVAANARTTADDASAPTPGVRVSTGLIAPTLVEPISIQVPDGLNKSFAPLNTTIGLSFTVDSQGHAQNVKVVKASNPFWDARVVEAIQNSQFRPGKLDEQAVPVDMNVTVNLQR